MLEVEVGDAVPWRPGHTVERLVPRDGTDLLTLDQHSKWGFTGWTVRTTDGGATQQHCCCWPLAPSLARSLAACTDWRRLNREKLPPERARAQEPPRSLARSPIHRSTHPAPPPSESVRRSEANAHASTQNISQIQLRPDEDVDGGSGGGGAAASAVGSSLDEARGHVHEMRVRVRPPARSPACRPTDRPTDVRVSPSCSGAA